MGGEAHYTVQTGHNRQAVFIDSEDREAFLQSMRRASLAETVAVHGYTLLDNEVHLVATPATAQGLSRFMQALSRQHGTRFNRRHGHVGTLWSSRFRSTVVDPDGYLTICLRCVERLSLPAACWSSAAHHLGLQRDPLLSEHLCYWTLGNTPFEREAAWTQALKQALTEEQLGNLQRSLQSGLPFGGTEFCQRVARASGRPTTPARRGRPRKTSILSPIF